MVLSLHWGCKVPRCRAFIHRSLSKPSLSGYGVLHGESNKGLASPRTTKQRHNQNHQHTNQTTTKQPTNKTVNLRTNHPTHHMYTHQPALHPHDHTSHNAPAQHSASDPRSSNTKTKCPQQHSNHIAHAHASTSNPQPSRHSLYAAQASRRTQPKGLHGTKGE